MNMSEKLANPAPLGLMGFGMTTILLNLHNAGAYGLGSMIIAMGITYGGLAQVIAGVMEYKKGNTFGTAAFTSYGLFWLSLVILKIFPAMNLCETPSNYAMAAYFLMWGLFTFVMFFATLKANRAIQFVFMSLAILFFLLTIKELMVAWDLRGIAEMSTVLGIEGVVCGLSAVYTALAEVLNESHGRTILPICPTNK
jgi:succinate-acetate transporter protein